MNDELKKAVQKSQATMQESHVKERNTFKTLLLTNPNYFGNLVSSQFTPVLSISGNTFYEELRCIGYHPQQRRLEGVVYIYQPSGYGTDVCGPGSPEYVRFYLSFDSGATWVDQGVTSFQAFNIPEGRATGSEEPRKGLQQGSTDPHARNTVLEQSATAEPTELVSRLGQRAGGDDITRTTPASRCG
jgi:hypothetical protein